MASKYLDTDLNVSPYYDDFDAETGYNRVLFKPSVPVQARELTQLQTILQNQIATFGDNILQAGTIINGCTLVKDLLHYVKVNDRATVDGTTDTVFAISEYSNGFLVSERGGSVNLAMQLNHVESGFEINNPDLNTFYGRYVNVGKTSTLDANGDQTTIEKFIPSTTLKFYDANGTINSVSISSGGSNYTNGDLVIFTSNFGSNASATVVTNAGGVITSVDVTDSGKDYLYLETADLTVNTATGSGASLSYELTSNVTFTVASTALQKAKVSQSDDVNYHVNSVSKAALADYQRFNVVGKTLSFQVTDGVVYQKGHFVDVDPHRVLVDRYTTTGNSYNIGFTTEETLVNSDVDSTLLDNAAGFNNENAPGADRLKLEATLKSVTANNVASTNNFFSILTMEEDVITRLQEDTEYSQIGSEMAKRTFEESGNYVTKAFTFATESIVANTTHDNILVGPGKGYVQGFRNETVGTSRIAIAKGLTTANVDNVTISQNFGNYVFVKEFLGLFQFQYGAEIKFLDTAARRISRLPRSSTAPSIPTGTGTNVTASGPDYDGNVMGTAKVRSIRFESGVPGNGDAQYRVYMFDINMDSGRDFRDVKAVYSPSVGIGDIVLEQAEATKRVLILDGTSQDSEGAALATVTPGVDTGFSLLGELNYSGSAADLNEGDGELVLEDALQDEPGFAQLKETAGKVLLRPLPNKGVKTLTHKPANNTEYTYKTLTSAVLETNGSITFSLTGDRTFPYTGGSTLSESEEKDFIIVANGATAQTANLTGTATTVVNSKVVIGTSTNFVNELQVGDTIKVHGGDTKQIAGITNSTHLELKTPADSARAANQYVRMFLDDHPIHLLEANTTSVSNVVISTTANSVTINATRGKALFGSQTLDVNIIHNVKKSNAQQKNKVLNANSYIKIDCSNNAKTTTGPWSLGIPDVYDIQKVYVATGNSTVAGSFTGIEAQANTSGGDKTDDFVLDTNQEDGFYNLSKLRQIASPSLALNANTKILVVARAFTQSGDGYGFFTVDSYPIDDETTTLPADKIRTEEIPVYTSSFNGKLFDLRDTIDFRKYAGNTANVSEATSATTASTNPANTVAFGESSSTEQFFAAPGVELNIDYQHYLPRVDTLALDINGQIQVKEGVASLTPIAPRVTEQMMPIASVSVPVFPSLTSKESRLAGRPDYSYSMQSKQIRNFTMKDIGQIKQDVEKLQYYTSLTAIEKATTDMTIPSSANTSLDRFKNGILVDNFSGRSPAAIIDREFKAGYDTARNIMTSKNKRQVIDIKPVSFANTEIRNNFITLTYDDKEDIKQSNATRTRNTAGAMWQFLGNARIYPDYDNYYDVRHPPENDISIDIDMASGLQTLVDAINEVEDFQSPTTKVIGAESQTRFTGTSSNARVVGSSGQRVSGGTNVRQQIETETIQHYETVLTEQIATVENQLSGTSFDTSDDVGTFVKDMKFNPYIREQTIFFYVNGLKPNSRHFIYFDEKDVSTKITPATVPDEAFVDGVITQDDFRLTGARGDKITTNALGEIFGALFIDPQTYHVGDRKLLIADKSTFESAADSSDSKSQSTFSAWNHSVEKGSLEISTKQLQISHNKIVTGTTARSSATRTGVSSFTQSSRTFFQADPPPPPPSPVRQTFRADDDSAADGDGDGDPLAQTFVVKMAEGAAGAFYTKCDVFFQTKDPNLGINLEIRRVENGYPTKDVLPYSTTSKKSADVNLSDDGSSATTFTFETPIFLKSKEEYCIVLLPHQDNPNYNAFCRKTGESDLITSRVTNKDTFTGVLFVSSNDRAWKPYEDEDVKFTLYRAKYNTGVGSVQYENADQEFFKLDETINGNFEQGEKIFKYDVSANLTGTTQFTSTSETISGTSTLFNSELALGNFVTLSNGTSHSTHKVTAIASNTSMTVQGFPNFSAQSSNTANVMFSPTGTVEFYENTKNNKEMFVKNTTAANATFLFANNDTIIGSSTAANTTIDEVKNLATSGFENLMYHIEPQGTTVTQFQQGNTATGQTANSIYAIDNTNRLTETQYIKSKSNEVVDGVGKSWKHTFKFTTNADSVSPAIDDNISNIARLENIINNDITNEYLPGKGNALAKYVSKVVTLDEGLDAEDITVLLTTTRPPGSNVRVYARVINEYDPEPFGQKHWSLLTRDGDDTFTDPTRYNDFIEMEFGFPTSPTATRLLGNANANLGSNIITTSTDLRSAVAPGDILQILNDPAGLNYQTEVITAESATTLTVANNLRFDNPQAELALLGADGVQTAFIDRNDQTVTYFNSNQIKFNGYKAFQIKIVLTSTDITRVPRVSDYRAIATTI
jgi:hypothetical protein